MGFLDTLLGGRKKLKPPAPDRLFAMTTAQVQLQAGLGLEPKGVGGIAFQQVATADFKQILASTEELLHGSAEDTGTISVVACPKLAERIRGVTSMRASSTPSGNAVAGFASTAAPPRFS